MSGAAMAGFKTYHNPSQWLALMEKGFGTMMVRGPRSSRITRAPVC